jgi:UDP-glucose 4-epimerase
MRIIVTGASGFLGKTLMRVLAARGIEAIGVARSAASDKKVLRVADYANAPAGDVLVHLAETRDRATAESIGSDYAENAILVLERLIAKAYGKVIYVSSALVYGDGSSEPHPTSDPVYAKDIYARTKLACEARTLNAGGVVARLSNLYGPAMAPNNVVSTILDQIPGDGPLRIRDDKPVRDFIWIEDAALALATMAESDCRGVYNVGTHTGVSVGELARLALRLAGQPERSVIAAQPGQDSWIILDIAETSRRLGWWPRTSLGDGIQTLLKSRRPVETRT